MTTTAPRTTAAPVGPLDLFAADSLLAAFRMVMTDRVEEAFGREFQRAVRQQRKSREGRGRRG